MVDVSVHREKSQWKTESKKDGSIKITKQQKDAHGGCKSTEITMEKRKQKRRKKKKEKKRTWLI
jgi:hypothetical protein